MFLLTQKIVTQDINTFWGNAVLLVTNLHIRDV